MKEKMSLNLMREFILYTGRNENAWRAIDEVYYNNYDNCIEVEEYLKDFFKEHNIDLKKESIEAALYIKRLSYLMLIDDTNMFIIMEKAFPKPYKYVISNTVVKVSNYMNRKIPKDASMDAVISEVLVLIVCALNYEDRLDKSDPAYNHMMQILYKLRGNRALVENKNKYKHCNKQRQKLLNELELILRGKYYESGYNSQGIHDFLEVKNYFDRSEGVTLLKLDQVKNDILAKIHISMEQTDFLVEGGFNANELLGEITIDKELVKDVINTYLLLSDCDEDKDIKKEDVNIDELTTYVAVSLNQLLFLEKYRKAHDFFFDNYDEHSNTKYKELLLECKSVKKERLLLQDEVEKLKLQIEELQRKLNKSSIENEKLESNNKELFELRNYIFNNQEECENQEEIYDEIDLDYLEGKKVVCFGGNKAWISNMSKEFDNWTFVPADAMNFDTAILRDADMVIIKATYIGHAMYYKVIANMPENAQIKFINNSNIDIIKKALTLQ